MLTNIQVNNLSSPGKHYDRDGLYLNINKSGSKSWVYRYQLNGKRTEMGLGSIKDVNLAHARDLALENRKLHKSGINPIAHRDKTRNTVPEVHSLSFDECAETYITAHEPSWRNIKHASQWRNTIKQYASPVFGHLPVDQIDTDLVMQVLDPIWHTKTETASRVRGRIENILSWAIVRGYRAGPNPALWRGHLSILLPQRSKVQAIRHYPALPYADICSFMQQLQTKTSLSAKALKLTILTACRTSEVLGAQWGEFDLEAKVWTIPAERMKARREHRVPLSDQIVVLLESINREVSNDWVFPSRNNKPLSNMAMLNLLQKNMGRSDLTVHGFRSTFKDWAMEETVFPGELSEAQLAHTIQNAAQAAYERGDKLEKRREMMQEWTDYLC